MDEHVLMIAYHFPPLRGSSGLQRTLRFVRYLPDFGWKPIVLTVHPRAYPALGEELLREIPQSVLVHRAFALDAARHLAIRSRYPRLLGAPDRYSSWLLGAVPAALQLVRKYRPRMIWSTYPIPTAHLIAAVVSRLTGLPWVADFRDPMLYDAWPEDPFDRRVHGWLERLALRRCARAIFVTQSAVDLYRQRYPQLPKDRFALVSNGYDESSFNGLTHHSETRSGRPLVFVHSGFLEPADRDPGAFLTAIGDLKRAGRLSARDLRVVLRGSGWEQQYQKDILAKGVEDIVSLAPTMDYRSALQEMLDADGLLIFQGPTCNRQIPAKAYEYMRAGTPILTIADPRGDTYQLLQGLGITSLAPFGEPAGIAERLLEFLALVRSGTAPKAAVGSVTRYERRALTMALSQHLDQIARDS